MPEKAIRLLNVSFAILFFLMAIGVEGGEGLGWREEGRFMPWKMDWPC